MDPTTSTPPSTPASTTRLPPSASMRSPMFVSPDPRADLGRIEATAVVDDLEAEPTITVVEQDLQARASACVTAFLIASRTQK
jgi:hypothetical protein